MADIADLIESVFASHMDSMGRRVLREMRTYGRIGPAGALLGKLLLPSAALPSGYVWEDAGRLVGNASLLPVDGFPHRWVLANVAVHPDFRGRGIGRRLTEACVAHVKQHDGECLLLQVDSDNQQAQVLYASLGFRPLATRAAWVGDLALPKTRSLDLGEARPRQRDEWKQQLALADRLHPEGLIWPYPLTTDLFRSSWWEGFLQRKQSSHWVWIEGGRLLGSLTARPGGDPNAWRIILIVDPESRGMLEEPLLVKALNMLGGRKFRLQLDYPAGIAGDVFRRHGLRVRRTLTWMGLDLG
jgi:ribosomal protein S18 acetylase RimI-like enzyme